MKPNSPQCLRASAKLFAALIWFSATACSAQNSAAAPQYFWSEFRAAVMAQDNAKLIQLTSFPLEIRGVDDGLPSKHYSADQFAEVFQQVLSQPVVTLKGNEVLRGTMKDVVRTTKAIGAADMMTHDSFRVGQLVFKLKGKQWRFSRAYLEE